MADLVSSRHGKLRQAPRGRIDPDSGQGLLIAEKKKPDRHPLSIAVIAFALVQMCIPVPDGSKLLLLNSLAQDTTDDLALKTVNTE